MNAAIIRTFTISVASLLCLLAAGCQRDTGSAQAPTVHSTVLESGWQYRWGDSPVDATGVPLWSLEPAEAPGWSPQVFNSWPQPETGKVQYQLWQRVRLPQSESGETSLFIANAWQSFEVYLGGRRIYVYGDVTRPTAEAWPGAGLHVIPLPAGYAGQVLAFRFASFNPSFIGVFGEARLGSTADHFLHLVTNNNMAKFVMAWLDIITGLLALVLFFGQRRDVSFAAFSGFTLTLGVYYLARSPLLHFFAHAPHLWNNVELFAVFFMGVPGSLFMESMVGRGYRGMLTLSRHILVAAFVGASAAVALGVSPWSVLLKINLVHVIVGPMIIANMIYGSIRGSYEAKILTMGTAVLMLTIVYDILISLGVLPRYAPLMEYGGAAFIMSMAYLVAYRFTQTVKNSALKVASLQFEKTQLDRENKIIKEMSQKMRNILDHVDEGILTFDASLAIDSEFSAFLCQLYDTTADRITGAQVVDFLFASASFSADELGRIKETFGACLGEEEISWMVNGSGLPTEAVAVVHGRRKFLGLQWKAILDEQGLIRQIMLSIRDLTQQRVLELEVTQQKAEGARLLELVDGLVRGQKNALSLFFEDSATRLTRTDPRAQAVYPTQATFRDLHTIKGGSRSVGLKGVANAVHVFEDKVQAALKGAAVDGSEMLACWSQVEQELGRYRYLFEKALGRSVEGSQDGPSPTIFGFVNQHLPLLQQVLADGGLSLGEMACHDGVVAWRGSFLASLTQMLTHALNNCVDHGYVLPRGRGRELGPAAFELRSRLDGDLVTVTVADRGAGFDLPKLRELCVKKGLPELADGNVLEVLFADGASTAETVTMTSGRGVGLSAIRAMARELGGDAVMTSPDGGGSCLLITVPAAIALDARPAPLLKESA